MDISINSKERCEPIIDKDGNKLYELLNSSHGAEKHSLAYFELQPGNSSDYHYHPNMEETYYILSGSGEILLNGETNHIRQGDTIYIPVSTKHQIINNNNEPLKILTISVPGWKPDSTINVGN